jgi:hypothetical protein
MIKSISDIRNIAVCFGGEPRTYDMCAENINHFFNLPNIDVKFFAHTWTDNTYKVPKTGDNPAEDQNLHSIDVEELNLDFIKEDLPKFFNFSKLKIEDKFDEHHIDWIDWDHLFYSDLQSNLLKRIYELENNMTFDVVVKCRFDLSFNPKINFLDLLNQQNIIKQKRIYADVGPFIADQYRVQMDDCFYYGSSFSMDLLQSNMWCFNRSLNGPDDSSLLIAGPGVRLAMYCNQLGLNLQDQMMPYFIYRKIHRPQNPMLNWQQIADEPRKIF